jgi:hypothetical protein
MLLISTIKITFVRTRPHPQLTCRLPLGAAMPKNLSIAFMKINVRVIGGVGQV